MQYRIVSLYLHIQKQQNMKNLTELTDKQIDKMAAAKRKLALKKVPSRITKTIPKPRTYKKKVIKCNDMDLHLYTRRGDNFFYVVIDGVEYYVMPGTRKLEEVGQN